VCSGAGEGRALRTAYRAARGPAGLAAELGELLADAAALGGPVTWAGSDRGLPAR